MWWYNCVKLPLLLTVKRSDACAGLLALLLTAACEQTLVWSPRHRSTTDTIDPWTNHVEHVANLEGHIEAAIVHPIGLDYWIAFQRLKLIRNFLLHPTLWEKSICWRMLRRKGRWLLWTGESGVHVQIHECTSQSDIRSLPSTFRVNHTIASKADGQKESIYNILHGDALNWREELGTVSVRSGLSPLEPWLGSKVWH